MFENISLIITEFNRSMLPLRKFNTTNHASAVRGKPPSRPWDFGEITLLILLIFGSIGNILTIMVMRTKRMRNSNAALLITCMASCDIILLFLKFIANMIKIYRIPIYNMCILIQVIPQAASFISVWLIVITSTERTFAVLTPLKVAFIFSKKRCKAIMLVLFLFFIALSSTTSVCIRYSVAQPYYCQIKGNKEGNCFFFYNYIFPWLKSSFGSWIPSVVGVILNIVMISALYKASNERRNILNQNYYTGVSSRTSSIELKNTNLIIPNKVNIRSLMMKNFKNTRVNSDTKKMSIASENNEIFVSDNKYGRNSSSANNSNLKEKQITIMLLTASISFILLTTPYSAYELLRKLNVNLKWLKNRNVMRAFMMLIDINHATNFILYSACAQRFRTELKSIVCCEFWTRNKRLPTVNKRNNSFPPHLTYNYKHSIFNRNGQPMVSAR